MSNAAWILALILTFVLAVDLGILFGAYVTRREMIELIQAYERTATNPSMHIVSKILELLRR